MILGELVVRGPTLRVAYGELGRWAITRSRSHGRHILCAKMWVMVGDKKTRAGTCRTDNELCMYIIIRATPTRRASRGVGVVAEDEVARRKWLRWTWTRDDCSHRLIGTFTLSLGIPRFAHHVESLTGSVCLSS